MKTGGIGKVLKEGIERGQKEALHSLLVRLRWGRDNHLPCVLSFGTRLQDPFLLFISGVLLILGVAVVGFNHMNDSKSDLGCVLKRGYELPVWTRAVGLCVFIFGRAFAVAFRVVDGAVLIDYIDIGRSVLVAVGVATNRFVVMKVSDIHVSMQYVS